MRVGTVVTRKGGETRTRPVDRAALRIVPTDRGALLLLAVRSRGRRRRRWVLFRPGPPGEAGGGDARGGEAGDACGRYRDRIGVEGRIRIEEGPRPGEADVTFTAAPADPDPADGRRGAETLVRFAAPAVLRTRPRATRVPMLVRGLGLTYGYLWGGVVIFALDIAGWIPEGWFFVALLGWFLLVVGLSFLLFRCPVCRKDVHREPGGAYRRGLIIERCRYCDAPV